MKAGYGQQRAVAILSAYVEKHGGGRIFTNVGFKMANDTCLEPDVAFVRDAHIVRTKLDDWFDGAPALAVEVISPANRAAKLDQKVRVYLDNGAEAVWVIDPIRKQLTAHHAGGHFEIFELPNGQVAETSIFPGLHIDLAALFEDLG